MTFHILCNNLFLQSKISVAQDQLASIEDADTIFVDLDHPDALTVIEKYSEKCVAFGSHVRRDQLEKAKKLRCRVYPRSVFFGKVVFELLK